MTLKYCWYCCCTCSTSILMHYWAFGNTGLLKEQNTIKLHHIPHLQHFFNSCKSILVFDPSLTRFLKQTTCALYTRKSTPNCTKFTCWTWPSGHTHNKSMRLPPGGGGVRRRFHLAGKDKWTANARVRLALVHPSPNHYHQISCKTHFNIYRLLMYRFFLSESQVKSVFLTTCYYLNKAYNDDYDPSCWVWFCSKCQFVAIWLLHTQR